jgi:DNA-binding LytR/AlgR family response regulator
MKRIPVRENSSVHLVRPEDIFSATARDKRVYLRTGAREHRTGYTLKELESMLPEEKFARIHDSAIVNLDQVEELILLGDQSYVVKLSNSQQIPVGHTHCGELQRKLGISH